MGKQHECPQQTEYVSNIRENVAWHIRTMGYSLAFKEKIMCQHNEPLGHYAKVKRSDTEGKVLHNSPSRR